ncbi:hypothetical protein Bbelb_203200 [Branchiostoma belcheri]|nr:hypothetical protein Bbelb_203200 [Branchiostoma belcheri]
MDGTGGGRSGMGRLVITRLSPVYHLAVTDEAIPSIWLVLCGNTLRGGWCDPPSCLRPFFDLPRTTPLNSQQAFSNDSRIIVDLSTVTISQPAQAETLPDKPRDGETVYGRGRGNMGGPAGNRCL